MSTPIKHLVMPLSALAGIASLTWVWFNTTDNPTTTELKSLSSSNAQAAKTLSLIDEPALITPPPVPVEYELENGIESLFTTELSTIELTTAGELPPTETTVAIATDKAINAWQIGPAENHNNKPYPHYGIQLHPQLLSQLVMSQELEFTLPDVSGALNAELNSTRNGLGGTQIWQGPLEGGNPMERVLIARGDQQTQITLISQAGTYRVQVDNHTGEGIIFNDRDAQHLPEPPFPESDNPYSDHQHSDAYHSDFPELHHDL